MGLCLWVKYGLLPSSLGSAHSLRQKFLARLAIAYAERYEESPITRVVLGVIALRA